MKRERGTKMYCNKTDIMYVKKCKWEYTHRVTFQYY